LFVLATLICRLKNRSRGVEVILERVTTVTQQRINFRRGIGLVRLG